MNAGGALYAGGGVDNKPPVIFWTYAAVYRAFGLYDMTAVHAFKVAVVLATAGLLFLITKRLANGWAAWLAALLYIAFTAAGYSQMAAANTEVFMMLPATLSLWLLLERRWAASGAVLALAVLTKQVGAVQLAVFPFAALWLRTGPRPLVRAAAGFAAGLALLLGVLALTGSLPGFWRWAVVSLITGYGPSAWSGGSLRGDLAAGAQQWLVAVPLLLLPALGRIYAVPKAEPEEGLARLWLLLSAIAAIAGGHFFGHYFVQVDGPLAVLSAIALATWYRSLRRPLLFAGAAALLAAPALASVVISYTQGGIAVDPVSGYVRAHTAPGDRIFVWGNSPDIYFFAGRIPATRFVGFLRGAPRGYGIPPRSWDTTPDVWPALASDFAAHPALYIVDTSPPNWRVFGPYPMSRFPVLPQILAQRYEKAAVVDGFVLYRLR